MTKARDLANSAAAFSAVSATELGYVDGVTSAIQTQLDAKAASSTAVTLTGTQTLTNKTLTSPALTTPTISTLTTAGDTVYGTGSGVLSRLGIGTAGQVLTVNSGATAPQWSTAASGATFVGANVYNSSNLTISNATFTTLTFNTEKFDTDTFHSTSSNTGRMTIPSGKNGKYLIIASMAFDGNGTGFRASEIQLNGVDYLKGNWALGYAADSTVLIATTTMDLVATDYVTITVYQNSGGNLNIQGGSGNSFSITYLGA